MKLSTLIRFVACASAASLIAVSASAEVDLQPYVSYATGSRPEAVVVGDFNNDGLNDVALNTSTYFDPENDYRIKVFIQDESGALQPSQDYAVSAEYTAQPKTLAAGDLNGDGLLDLAVGMDRSHIEIFLQYTDGTLFSAATIETPLSTRIAVADLNGDGLDDIAGIDWGGDQVGIFYQGEMGISRVAETHYAPHGGYDDMVLGDINGDGANDIVVMSGQSYARDNLAVVTSDGQGSFLPVAFYDLGGDKLTKGVTIGDINNDGLNDVAVTFGGNRPNPSIAVFYQGDDGALRSPQTLSSFDIPETILTADISSDGKDEVLVLHGGQYALGLYAQGEDIELSEETLFDMPYASHYNPQGMDSGDINSDGINDVVVADYNHGLVVLSGNTVDFRQAPIADAGEDQRVDGNALVMLDGSHSADTDGTIVDYQWTQTFGPSVTLNDSGNGFVTFVAPPSIEGAAQLLAFQPEVVDNDGLSSTDTVTVSINRSLSLDADAGANQTVVIGASVVLNGSASRDPDGTLFRYAWRQVSGSPVELKVLSGGSATFVAPTISGPLKKFLEFELEVTDGNGRRATDNVFVLIEGGLAPTAEAGPSQSVKAGDFVTLDGGMSSDTDGNIAEYRWRQLTGAPLLLAQTGDATGTFIAPPTSAGLHQLLQFELEVIDNDGLSAKDTVYVTVSGSKLPIANAGADQTVKQSSLVELNASGSEAPDGEIASYHWTQVGSDTVVLSGADSTIATFEAPKLKGRDELQLHFVLTVVDDLGGTSLDRVMINVVR